jgi:hypothetical protein
MRTSTASFGDFRCARCHIIVSAAHLLSGVNNRNHCPYCLWSCHLDLFAAGDRLSACKAPMKPIGLTIKKGKNKYQSDSRGELMLIHECVECQTLSINRIAADDDSGTVMAVFQESFIVNRQIHAICREQGIVILSIEDIDVVYSQLYGRHAEFPVLSLR